MKRRPEVKIGDRILYKEDEFETTLYEGKVKEISPSGEYVKIGPDWYEREKVFIVEILSIADTKKIEKEEKI